MKILKRWLFGLLVISLLQISCKKEWLNERSDKNLAIPTTFKDFQALLDYNGVMNGTQVGLGEVGTDGFYCRPDFLQYLSDNERNAYTWSHEFAYLEVLDWNHQQIRGAYPKIYYCNVVLDGLKNISPISSSDQAIWNNIKGQALFQRARCFFDLAQVFAPPFNRSQAETDLGIPLRLESDINIPSTRSTIKETYDRIISDLELSLELLPEKAQYVTRGSKWASHAMLARIYLSIEEYEKAKSQAEAALAIDNGLLDFSQLNINDSYPIGRLNSEVIFHSNLLNYTPITYALIEPQFFNQYREDDLRKLIYFKDNGNSTISFKGSYSGGEILFGGLAVDEMYLIRAECLAREGKVFLAMEDLNKLLHTRWKKENGQSTYVNKVAADVEDALTNIVEERRKELFFRGLRWSDLRRLNRDPRFAITLTKTVEGKTYTLEPNSFRYTLPIPDDIIQWTGMQQNSGW